MGADTRGNRQVRVDLGPIRLIVTFGVRCFDAAAPTNTTVAKARLSRAGRIAGGGAAVATKERSSRTTVTAPSSMKENSSSSVVSWKRMRRDSLLPREDRSRVTPLRRFPLAQEGR